jgi:hypothetical protein
MRRVAAAIVLGVLFGPVALVGQPPPPPPPPRDDSPASPRTGTIRGRVLAADTGDPIRNARVALNDDEHVAAVLTDGDGRFALTAIAAGRHIVSAAKTGYATTIFGARGTGRPSRVDVATGGAVDGIEVRMPKGGAISGRVVDEAGDPLPLTTILAEQIIRIDGRIDTRRVRTVETDDLGEYRIFGLSAGRFIVSVVRVGGDMGPGLPVDVEGNTTWTHSYYPGVTGLAQAQAIAVRPGDDVPGIDFTSSPARRPTVSVTVSDASGNPVEAQVAFGSDSALAVSNFIMGTGPSHGTVMSSLDQGNWTVLASGPKGVGVAHVSLGSEDAAVAITLIKGGRLAGRVVTDGTPLPSGTSIELDAFPTDAALARAGAFARPGRMNLDGTFELTGLIGAREVRLRNGPRGWALKDVVAGGRSLLDAPPEFAGVEDITGVEVILSDRHSELGGRLVSPTASSSSPTDYSVLVFAEDRGLLRNARRWARWVRPNFGGGFIVDDLLPGTYLAVAVPADDVDETQWLNADYLDRFRSRAARVTLADREKKSIVLEMVDSP